MERSIFLFSPHSRVANPRLVAVDPRFGELNRDIGHLAEPVAALELEPESLDRRAVFRPEGRAEVQVRFLVLGCRPVLLGRAADDDGGVGQHLGEGSRNKEMPLEPIPRGRPSAASASSRSALGMFRGETIGDQGLCLCGRR